MSVSEIDRLLGIEVYATQSKGVGGSIRKSADDFIVEEVLVDGNKASVKGSLSPKVLGSTPQRQRFLLCVMIKRNWDTFIAVKNIAKTLGIDQNRVQFAGIKDAKAVTAQHITLEGISIEDVSKVDVRDIEIKPIGYIREQLSLFYLLGNNFTIFLRGMQTSQLAAQEQIPQTIEELHILGGIPNFYGHQRFGTTRAVTHHVGRALAQGKFWEAAMLFLGNPSPHEHPASRVAREELQSTGDFKRASENFPKQLRFERLMLTHLSEHPTDFVGAFQRLPRKLQSLFVQAHQSFLFNRFLSERMKEGLPLNEATVGDFVVGVERSGLPMTTVYKIVTAENISEINTQIRAGKLRVSLPIIGLKQKLSQGIMGRIENNVLSQEGLGPGKIWANELSRVGGKGGLRTLLTPVKGFALHNVSGDNAQFSFMLNRGCYATVVLREIMKPSDPITAGF